MSSVVPGEAKTKSGGEYVDNYIEHYNCSPPPLFMILISIAEVKRSFYNVSNSLVSSTMNEVK